MRVPLVRTGREPFVRVGDAATGTAAIVAAVGVTRAALYHHFADKAALLSASHERTALAIDQDEDPTLSTQALERLVGGAVRA
jgi:AcrR family transcriptional regulator